MAILQQISALALFAFAFLSLACCVLLSVAYWRREKREKGRRERWRADIADISILFQTMRDVIGQQKALAREFNQELDTKMALVKQVLAATLEKNERLFEQQQRIARGLDDARSQLESVQRQVRYLQDSYGDERPRKPIPPAATAPSAPAPKGAERRFEAEEELEEAAPKAYVSFDSDRDRSPAASVARDESPLDLPFEEDPLAGTGLTDGAYAKWEGFDFDAGRDREIEPRREAREEYIPQAPEDAEAARQAFRALLDIGDGGEVPDPITPGIAPGASLWDESSESRQKSARSNGRGKADALRQRILEYNDAGMSVPDIARELGVGKGEVRLMLSLARQQRP